MISAYEIRLIVSAQDHFSSAFRRINNDLRYMSRLQAKAAREQAALNKQLNIAKAGRRQMLNEARSLKSGQAYKKLMAEQGTLANRLALQEEKRAKILERQAKFAKQTAKFTKASEIQAAQNYRKARRALSRAMKAEGEDRPSARQMRELQENVAKTRLRREGWRNAVDRIKATKRGHLEELKGLNKEIAATKALQAANLEAQREAQMAMQQRVAMAKKYHTTVGDINRKLDAQRLTQERLAQLEYKRARWQSLGHAGRVATLGGGLALAAGAGLANYYAQFSQQAQVAATQMPGTVGGGVPAILKSRQMLEPQIMQMIREYGFAADELSQSAYDIFSSIRLLDDPKKGAAQGFDIMRLSAMAAVGGLTDLDTATRATIVLANQFGSSFDQMSKNLDTAFAIVKFGNITFGEFTDMLTKTGPAAAALGVSLEEVGGMMAFLTKKSGKPQEAATWIARLFQTVATPEFIKGMRSLGTPIDEEGKLKPLTEVMDQILRLGAANRGKGGLGMQNIIPFITSVGKHGVAGGAGLRSTIQAQRGMIFSLQDIKALKQAMKDVSTDQGEFLQSFDAMYNDAGMKWQRQIAAFKAGALELGKALIGPMTTVIGYIAAAVDWFSQLSPEVKRTAGVLFTFGAALTFVSGIFGSLIASVVSFVLWTRMMRTASRNAGGAAGMGAMASGIMRVSIVAAGAITILAGLKQVFDDFVQRDVQGNKFQKVMRGILGFTKGAAGSISLPGKWGLLFTRQFNALEKGAEALYGLDWLTGKSVKRKKDKGKDLENDVTRLVKRVQKAANKAMADMTRQQRNSWAGKALEEVLNQTTSPDEYTKAVQDRANQVVERQRAILDQAADNLMRIYNEFEQANASAMGELFQGSWMNSEEMQLREEWNWTTGINDMIKDLTMTTKDFKKWRAGLAALAKKGLPKDFIAELKKKGMKEGMPLIEEILKAKPGQVQKLAAAWKARVKTITSATKGDFKDKLDEWKKLGSTMALQIAAGISSEDYALETAIKSLVDKAWSDAAAAIADKEIPPVPKPASDPTVLPDQKFAKYPIDFENWRINPNLTRKAWIARLPKGPNYGMPDTPTLRPGVPPATGNPVAGDRQTSSTGNTYVFQVNGTFTSEEEMMQAAMRSAAARLRNKR